MDTALLGICCEVKSECPQPPPPSKAQTTIFKARKLAATIRSRLDPTCCNHWQLAPGKVPSIYLHSGKPLAGAAGREAVQDLQAQPGHHH